MTIAIIERLRAEYEERDCCWAALVDCAEALERLRVAQRAYMADRGNDALGKKVGEAAIVADAALAALERSGK